MGQTASLNAMLTDFLILVFARSVIYDWKLCYFLLGSSGEIGRTQNLIGPIFCFCLISLWLICGCWLISSAVVLFLLHYGVQMKQNIETRIETLMERIPKAKDRVHMFLEYDMPGTTNEITALREQLHTTYYDIMRYLLGYDHKWSRARL